MMDIIGIPELIDRRCNSLSAVEQQVLSRAAIHQALSEALTLMDAFESRSCTMTEARQQRSCAPVKEEVALSTSLTEHQTDARQ
jgi:hypothetical protein